MKKIVFVLLMVSFAFSLNYEKAFSKLTLRQQLFLYIVYQHAKKTKYKWTLTAIAWKETLAGEALVNVFDGGEDDAACGPYHNLLSSVFERHPEWVKTKFNMNKICTRLITDINFATKEAVDELNYWYRVRKGNWFKVWASYNGGTKYKKGEKYAYDIYMRIKALKKIIGKRWDYGFIKLSHNR